MIKKLNFSHMRRVFDNNWFILKLIFKTTPGYALYSCIYIVMHEIIVFIEHTYMIKYIIDSIQYSRPFRGVLIFVSIVFTFVAIWFIVVNYFCAIINRKATVKLAQRLQLDFYQKASELDLECYDNPEFYNDFVWCMSEITDRTQKVLNNVCELLGCITAIVVTGIMMLSVDRAGLIFVASSFVTTMSLNVAINKIRFKMDVDLKPKQRKRDYINRVFYLNDFAKEIRLSSVKDKLYKDFNTSTEEITSTIKSYTKRLTVLDFISSYILNSFIMDGLYVIYLMYRALVRRVISYGTMVALFNVSWRLKSGLQRFTGVIPRFQQDSLYIDKMRKFLEYEPRIRDNTDTAGYTDMPVEPAPLILENVSFSYNDETGLVLKNINLSINPREKIAFVGYNGAGKTTLIKLLMRLYDVTEGQITYNGRNIKDYPVKSYRNGYGTVFQDYQLFAATVAENVAMDSTGINEDRVIDVLEQSGFKSKLEQLKNGIHTQLTREFDDEGINISGGEAQKIAIARAFYKPSQIIVLDEPSSALDPVSEYHLNETMMKAARDKTVIFISHRLSTTRMADRIYMLENGEIIEEGSHKKLMDQNGKYAEMFNMQAEKYGTRFQPINMEG